MEHEHKTSDMLEASPKAPEKANEFPVRKIWFLCQVHLTFGVSWLAYVTSGTLSFLI